MSTANKDRPPLKPSSNQETPPASARPDLDVRDLLGAAREAILVHQGEHYRLRVTAKDKLILTK